MGISLALIPLAREQTINDAWDGFGVIQLGDHRELFEAIGLFEDRTGKDLGLPIWTLTAFRDDNGENGYGQKTESPYGSPLRFVEAVALYEEFASHPGVQVNFRNRAAWAYLSQLPADWKIVLDWS